MRSLIIIVTLCGLFGCTSGAFSTKPPEPTPTPTPKPSPSPEPVDPYAGREMLFAIADKDLCKDAVYTFQGSSPQGYRRGVVLTYAKVICSPESDVYKIGSQPVGSSANDFLAHYGMSPATPTDRLNTTFATVIASNAYESSWRPCVGRDTVAKKSDIEGCLNGVYNGIKYTGSGSTCEAGLDQKSYNAIAKSGPSRDLYEDFLSYPKGCFKTEYYGKTTCSEANWKNHGSDPKALEFQSLQKNCPGYTVESAIIGFRTIRSHWGPINIKQAKPAPACVAMFERVRQLMLKNPALCQTL